MKVWVVLEDMGSEYSDIDGSEYRIGWEIRGIYLTEESAKQAGPTFNLRDALIDIQNFEALP